MSTTPRRSRDRHQRRRKLAHVLAPSEPVQPYMVGDDGEGPVKRGTQATVEYLAYVSGVAGQPIYPPVYPAAKEESFS